MYARRLLVTGDPIPCVLGLRFAPRVCIFYAALLNCEAILMAVRGSLYRFGELMTSRGLACGVKKILLARLTRIDVSAVLGAKF